MARRGGAALCSTRVRHAARGAGGGGTPHHGESERRPPIRLPFSLGHEASHRRRGRGPAGEAVLRPARRLAHEWLDEGGLMADPDVLPRRSQPLWGGSPPEWRGSARQCGSAEAFPEQWRGSRPGLGPRRVRSPRAAHSILLRSTATLVLSYEASRSPPHVSRPLLRGSHRRCRLHAEADSGKNATCRKASLGSTAASVPIRPAGNLLARVLGETR